MKHIAVVIRTYSRIDDTLALIQIIKQKWISHQYTIFVVHNGAIDGHIFPENSIPLDVQYISVEKNSGHQAGASDLLLAAFEHLTDTFDYTLFIESDCWPLNENLINEALMHEFDVATTIWVESKQSLAVDFFITSQKFILQHKNLMLWHTKSPEVEFKNYLLACNAKIFIFPSLRPIHMPSIVYKFSQKLPSKNFSVGSRFNLFPTAKILTFHVENLPNGIHTKKQIANILLEHNFFDIPPEISPLYLTKWEYSAQQFARFFPQSSWFKKNYWKGLKQNTFIPYT